MLPAALLSLTTRVCLIVSLWIAIAPTQAVVLCCKPEVGVSLEPAVNGRCHDCRSECRAGREPDARPVAMVGAGSRHGPCIDIALPIGGAPTVPAAPVQLDGGGEHLAPPPTAPAWFPRLPCDCRRSRPSAREHPPPAWASVRSVVLLI